MSVKIPCETQGLAVAIREATLSPMSFLKQNWPWIVVPLVLFAVAVYVILASADPAVDPNTYPTR